MKKIVVVALLVIILGAIGLVIYKKGASLPSEVNTQGAAVITTAPLKVSILQGPKLVMVGDKVTFTASAGGGKAPYTYSWTFSNGASASGQYGNWTAAAPLGVEPVNVAVKDATGKVAISDTTIKVISDVQGAVVSGINTSKGNISFNSAGRWASAYPMLGFTITNIGKDPIYISKYPSYALSTTTTGRMYASSTVTSVVASGSTANDASTSYVVMPGASRKFTYNYSMDNTNGPTTGKELRITEIKYGFYDGHIYNNKSIISGLGNLYVTIP